MGASSRAFSAATPSLRSASAPVPSRWRTASPWASASRASASASGPRAMRSSIVLGKPPRPWRTVPRSRARSAASAARSRAASPTSAPTRGFDDPLRKVIRCMSALLQQHDEDACRLLRLVERVVDGALGGVLDLAAAEQLLALALRHHRELTVQHVGELVGDGGVLLALEAGREHELVDRDAVVVEHLLLAHVLRRRRRGHEHDEQYEAQRQALHRSSVVTCWGYGGVRRPHLNGLNAR